jgi:hypothetical protein
VVAGQQGSSPVGKGRGSSPEYDDSGDDVHGRVGRRSVGVYFLKKDIWIFKFG